MTSLRRFLGTLKKICLTRGEKAAYHPISGVINEADLRLNLTMDEQQFFASVTQVCLLPHEKVAIREAILSQATSTPWWKPQLMKFTSVVASLLIVTMVGGSVSYAAENTVPGDFLYPIKINVNERVMQSMARSPDDRALVETTRAARRLAEAKMLLKRAEMNEEKQQMLASALDTHMHAVRSRMDTLKKEGHPSSLRALSAQVDATLRDQSRDLRRMKDKRAMPILHRVRAERVMAQAMELSAAMQEDGAVLPMPTMEQAADVGAAVAADDTMLAMRVASPELSTAMMEDGNHDEMEEELRLAAEARLLVVHEEMQTLAASASAQPDDTAVPAVMLMTAESVEEAPTTEEKTDTETNASEEPVIAIEASPASIELLTLPDADPLGSDSAEEMVRRAEKELRSGNAPEAVRAANSALEKVREMKKEHGKRDEWKPAAKYEQRNDHEDGNSNEERGSIDARGELQ